MSDQTANPADLDARQDDVEHSAEDSSTSTTDADARGKDFARMRRIGSWHAAAVLAALSIWGAADFWANGSGLVLAHIVALGNAIVAGIVISSIVHEWGHFTGAKLANSVAPVFAKPKRFYFMFRFDMEANSVDQFLWLSMGGILANWLLVLLFLVLVPLETLAGAMLIGVVTAQAVNVSVFEVPVVMRTRETQNPQGELDHQLNTVGFNRIPGLIVGALTFLALT